MEKRGKITIPLETYEEMIDELVKLRKLVNQKTIIKHRLDPIYGYMGLAFVMFLILYVS
jgi:hypothetical protein